MSAERLKRLIPTLNGGWALAVRWPNGAVLAATDRIRSVPLFYTTTDTEFVVAADTDTLLERRGTRPVKELSALEFLLVGYVTGRDTASKWQCNQAGIHYL